MTEKQGYDLGGIELGTPKQVEDNRIKKIESAIANLMQSNDSLYQMIHNKGLDVGLPRRIRDDIREMIQRLNSFSGIWENREARLKRREFDERIKKLISRGDPASAFWEIEERLREREADLDGARMIINDLTIRFQRLDNELDKHEVR